MALITVDYLNGNDGNAGNDANPLKTISQAHTNASAGDTIQLRTTADHVMSANLAITKNLSFRTHPSDSGRAVITGNYSFTNGTGVTARFTRIKTTGVLSTGIFVYGNAASLVLDDCEHVPTTTGGKYTRASSSANYVVISNCYVQDVTDVTDTGAMNSFVDIKNTKVKNCSNSAFLGAYSVDVEGCLFIACPTILRYQTTASFQFFLRFAYNTVDGKDGNGVGTNGDFAQSNASSTNYHNLMNAQVYSNVFVSVRDMARAVNSGSVDIYGYNCRGNWIDSAATLTNFASSGDTYGTDPNFRDRNAEDYRLDTGSACAWAGTYGGSQGAEEFGKPTGNVDPDDDYFSDPGIAKVESGQTYKFNSYSNNRTGSLVGGAADYPAEADVRDGVIFDSGGKTGTAKIPGANDVRNGVDVDATVGNIILPSITVVKTGSGGYGSNGTEFTPAYSPDFPAAGNVLPNDTTDGVTGTADVDALANLPDEADVLTGSGNFGKNLDKFPSYTPDFPEVGNVLPADTVDGVTGTADVDALANLPAEANVKTGSGNYGKNLDKVPSYTPDFPERANVAPDDTVDGQAGLMDLPALSSVEENDTLRGVPGTLHILVSDSIDPTWLESGRTVTINDVEVAGTNKGENFNDEIPENKVESGFEFQNLGVNKTGSLISSGPDSSPASEVRGKLIKGETIILDGVEVEGEYDTDEYASEPTGDQKWDILQELENELYQVQGIKKVDIEFGSSPGTVESEDMPHVQVSGDAEDYDHRVLANGGQAPVVKWNILLRVTASASYEHQDMFSLMEKIQNRIQRPNFTLNGTAVSVELKSSRFLPREEDSESEVRQFELALLVTYIREIN